MKQITTISFLLLLFLLLLFSWVVVGVC